MIKTCKPIYAFVILALISGINCSKRNVTEEIVVPEYNTKNVVIVMVDGARYTETWGDPSHKYIPRRYEMLQQGVLYTSFFNNGTTATVPGHIATTTGVYQNIPNDGTAYPDKPSLFQHWLQSSGKDSSKAWVITTKDKLEVLSDCIDAGWKGKYRPMRDCGVAGLGTGYRTDKVTFNKAQSVLTTDHPQLLLINFKQPDVAGHAADSSAYLKGITDTDNYIYLLWQQLQSDEFYKDKTTLIVTNDHGRHTAGHLDGFVSHGDACEGCRHIEMFAIGPDFKKNYVSNTPHEQIDISSTVAELMNFEMPNGNGKVLSDIFTAIH
jgi:predicted AlkP superfamily pyrophosphatase or phosphodiesterase